jgi:hypothetical protein
LLLVGTIWLDLAESDGGWGDRALVWFQLFAVPRVMSTLCVPSLCAVSLGALTVCVLSGCSGSARSAAAPEAPVKGPVRVAWAAEPGELAFDDPERCEDSAEAVLDGPEPPSASDAREASLAKTTLGASRDRLDGRAIRTIVRQHSDGFLGCYEIGRGRHRKLAGRVTARFAIGANGKISSVLIASNELPDCSVVECIRDHFATIEFPAPGSPITVEYPLVFAPASH